MTILFIAYVVLGYWSVGQTIWRNRIIIEFEFGAAFIQRLTWGCLFGWILIPAAFVIRALEKRK